MQKSSITNTQRATIKYAASLATTLGFLTFFVIENLRLLLLFKFNISALYPLLALAVAIVSIAVLHIKKYPLDWLDITLLIMMAIYNSALFMNGFYAISSLVIVGFFIIASHRPWIKYLAIPTLISATVNAYLQFDQALFELALRFIATAAIFYAMMFSYVNNDFRRDDAALAQYMRILAAGSLIWYVVILILISANLMHSDATLFRYLIVANVLLYVANRKSFSLLSAIAFFVITAVFSIIVSQEFNLVGLAYAGSSVIVAILIFPVRTAIFMSLIIFAINAVLFLSSKNLMHDYVIRHIEALFAICLMLITVRITHAKILKEGYQQIHEFLPNRKSVVLFTKNFIYVSLISLFCLFISFTLINPATTPEQIIKSTLLLIASTKNFVIWMKVIIGSSLTITGLVTKSQINAEIAQQAMQAAQQANTIKTQFLSNMSHEMRTPLNGILGITQVIENYQLKDENLNQWFSIMRQSAQRLNALVMDSLDIRRIEQGKIHIELKRFNIKRSLENLWPLLELKTNEKDITLKINNQLSNDLVLIGDPERLYQIIENLTSNAIKFTDHGEVSVSLEYANNKLLIKVSDTGIGIDNKMFATIFNAYQQLDSGNKKRYQGIGVGLTIVKELVERMGGTIEVSSELNVGSIFTVALPFAIANQVPFDLDQNLQEKDYPKAITD